MPASSSVISTSSPYLAHPGTPWDPRNAHAEYLNNRRPSTSCGMPWDPRSKSSSSSGSGDYSSRRSSTSHGSSPSGSISSTPSPSSPKTQKPFKGKLKALAGGLSLKAH